MATNTSANSSASFGDAQERTLAGTAQAVATALTIARDCSRPSRTGRYLATERTAASGVAIRSRRWSHLRRHPPAPRSPEIEQIIQGLSRTTARIWVSTRDLDVLARAGSLKGARSRRADPPRAPTLSRFWQWLDRMLHPFYALVLTQPTDDFNEEQGGRILLPAREIDGALAGILTVDRRFTPDGKAVIVSAAHPIWVGDQVRGAVIVEETTNTVLAERNRAFERLFSIVSATSRRLGGVDAVRVASVGTHSALA